jgi:hypothetical protein
MVRGITRTVKPAGSPAALLEARKQAPTANCSCGALSLDSAFTMNRPEKAVGTARKNSSEGKLALIMKKSDSLKVESASPEAASRLIDARIQELGDWRGEMLSRLRALIKQADPEVVEEWKWEIPVWSHGGILCTGETYKKVVKMTFAKGASLDDPSGLFNSSLEGKVRRAIDFREGEKINEKALKTLIRAAVDLNTSKALEG